jgi:hypothetical protein
MGGSSPPSPRTRRWSARPTSSPPRTSTRPVALHPSVTSLGRRSGGSCWPGCWSAGHAGGAWNQPGPTASPPTGAATATRPQRNQIPNGRRTPTSARTASAAPAGLARSTDWCQSRRRAPTADPPRHRRPAPCHRGGRDRVPARAADHPHLRPCRRHPACRKRQGRPDHHPESKLTEVRGPVPEGGTERTAGRPALAAASAQVTSRHARNQTDTGNYCVRGASPPKSQWLLSGDFALAGELA